MSGAEYIFFDTDMLFHRLDFDDAIKSAAENCFAKNLPSALSEFSLVEFKSSYLQDLCLLQRKITDSKSFPETCARIRSTGGRKFIVMLGILIKSIENFSLNPWEETRLQLLTYLDSQIAVLWDSLLTSVDTVFRDLRCSRATEEPEDNDIHWTVRVPHCNKENTYCRVVDFIEEHRAELIRLVDALNLKKNTEMTKELYKIRDIAMTSISETFPWQENVCRKVGDLLIGLQSIAGQKLISSNKKEHSVLHEPLGYIWEEFPVANIRLK